MRALTALATLLLSACIAGGATGPAPTLRIIPPDEVTLVEGQSVEISLSGAPTPLVMKFSRVLSDSRCPAHVQCVWAGEVAVLLTYSGEASGELSLTLPASEGSPASGNAGRYQIVLLEVTPYPAHGAPLPPTNRVKLGVTVAP